MSQTLSTTKHRRVCLWWYAYTFDNAFRKLLHPVPKLLGKFVKNGDRVVIKPNIGWDRSPELAANTHPSVVKALVQHALEAGAKKVQVFDRTCNEERRCYNNSGILPDWKELNESRVQVEYIDERKFVPVKI